MPVPGRKAGTAVALALVVAAVCLTAAAGGASRRTYFTNDCTTSRYRPHHLVATCGDASIRVIRIQWGRYGRRRADGHGLAITNDCVPNCAHGKFSHDAASVHLRRPHFCANVHRTQFTHLRLVYVGKSPPVPQRALRFPFPCSQLR